VIDVDERTSLDECMRGVHRVLVMFPPGARELAHVSRFLQSGKDACVDRITLLSTLPNVSQGMTAIEELFTEMMGDGGCIVQSSIVMEDLLQMAAMSKGGSHVLLPMGRGTIAPISSSDLGLFCAMITVSDTGEGSVLEVTGPDLVDGEKVARAVSASAKYDPGLRPQPGSVVVSEFAEAISQDRCAVVATKGFEETIGSLPGAFDKWILRHGAELALVLTRIGGVSPKQPQSNIASGLFPLALASSFFSFFVCTSCRRDSTFASGLEEEEEDATSEHSMDDRAPSSGDAVELRKKPSIVGQASADTYVDLIKLRESCSSSFGNPCPQCGVPFGVTRVPSACCECNVLACRKCVRPFESALVECTQRFATPVVICDKCLPG
jgi:hypothetical protein